MTPLARTLLQREVLFIFSLVLSIGGLRSESLSAQYTRRDALPKELNQLFQNYFEEYLRLFPTFATLIGDHRYDDKLQIEISEDHRQEQRTLYSTYLRKLSEVDRSALQDRDRLNYDIFKYDLDLRLAELQFKEHLIPDLNPYTLLRAIAPNALGRASDSLKTTSYYNNYLKRLKVVPAWTDTAIINLRQGMAEGFVSARSQYSGAVTFIERMLSLTVQGNLFYEPILHIPETTTTADKSRIALETAQVIQQGIIPAYKKLLRFVKQEYLPKTNPSNTARIRAGKDRYAYLTKAVTTTSLTPDEVFQMAMDESMRLKTEIQQMQEKMGFKRSLSAFQTYLQNSAPTYNRQNLIETYQALGKTLTARLPQLFVRVPNSTYDIKPVEGLVAGGIIGAYEDSGIDDSHHGIVYLDRSQVWVPVNVSLFLHEAVPGHHLQRSLQPSDLPRFRRYGNYRGFVEGWATYAETLGGDLGAYADPYQRFVYLQSNLSKALRVALDVGLYHKGWTAADARQFWTDQGGLIVQRGQLVVPLSPRFAPVNRAFAYKIGQLKFAAIRSKAEKSLGAKFDIRVFHDELLKDGAMPLDLLETKMNMWIKNQLR